MRIPKSLAVTVLLGCTSPQSRAPDARVADAHPEADAGVDAHADAHADAELPIDAPPDTPIA